MKRQRQRLDSLRGKLHTVPVPSAVAQGALERFRETGEIPDDDRLARAVIHRVRLGPRVAELYDSGEDEQAIVRAVVSMPEPPADEVMESLWSEAIDGPETLRGFARAALQGLVANGVDPTTRAFADLGITLQLPDYGSVGMFILGYPKSFAIPPYKRQARRLFARADKLRQRINQDDRRWFNNFGEALEAFLDFGELPEDELLLDAVLVGAEIEALRLHTLGNDVADCMATLDSAARATGPDWDVAIESLQRFAAESRFRTPRDARLIDPSGDPARPLPATRLPSTRRRTARTLGGPKARLP